MAPKVRSPVGLSPLARGKQVPRQNMALANGPIPAGAGETKRYPASMRVKRAYPRWRGGNAAINALLLDLPGLSPLARGKLAVLRM